jgi:hypothetical protein
MKIDDNELKRLLKEGMEYEADLIMREVESDPNMKDVVAPEDLHTYLWKQIREREEAVEKEQAEQEKEEQELIRLGKKYKKKLSRRKYIILIAAVVCALAVGSVSFGDGEKVFSEMKRKLGGREQTLVNTPSERHAVVDEIASEEEAYEQINQKLGFYPVPMHYIPEAMEFVELNIDDIMQVASIYYMDEDGKNMVYRIATKNREGSVVSDVEDVLVKEYEKTIEGTTISVSEYKVEENNSQRWTVNFIYEDAQYSILLMDVQQEEVEEIIKNLYFS